MPQGQSSPTFKRPPLDGSLLLPEIFDHHAQQSPNHLLFRYVDAEGVAQNISWLQAVQAFHKAAHIVRQQVNGDGPEIHPVIAIVASTGLRPGRSTCRPSKKRPSLSPGRVHPGVNGNFLEARRPGPVRQRVDGRHNSPFNSPSSLLSAPYNTTFHYTPSVYDLIVGTDYPPFKTNSAQIWVIWLGDPCLSRPCQWFQNTEGVMNIILCREMPNGPEPTEIRHRLAKQRGSNYLRYINFHQQSEHPLGNPSTGCYPSTARNGYSVEAMLDTVVDGVAAWNTNDLFLRHPSNPNLWKVYGRLGENFREHSFHPVDSISSN
ncbi:hypothetical protein DFH09DRAFT_1098314 [Mycena vulgaris]|nr:hypothetical protein DFH09DRAFT_1098314 [Mycena vulgaris]